MREFPVFVPYGEEHLAAIVTVPDGPPRGLAALLTGVGALRSHRFQVWARAARSLAEREIASVRLDWQGIGDSTGDVDAWDFGVESWLLDQAMTVLAFASGATGVDRTAAVGNCSGARIALLLAAQTPACEGAACILLPMVPGAAQQTLRKVSRGGVLGALRRNGFVRRLIVPRIKDLGGMDAVAGAAIERTLEGGRLLLLYGEDDGGLTARTRSEMERLVSRLPPERRDRYELRVLPVSKMAGFDRIPTQQMTLEAVVGWLDDLFPPYAAIARPVVGNELRASDRGSSAPSAAG